MYICSLVLSRLLLTRWSSISINHKDNTEQYNVCPVIIMFLIATFKYSTWSARLSAFPRQKDDADSVVCRKCFSIKAYYNNEAIYWKLLRVNSVIICFDLYAFKLMSTCMENTKVVNVCCLPNNSFEHLCCQLSKIGSQMINVISTSQNIYRVCMYVNHFENCVKSVDIRLQ